MKIMLSGCFLTAFAAIGCLNPGDVTPGDTLERTSISVSALSSIGGAISQSEVLQRAQYWVDQGYIYSPNAPSSYTFSDDASGKSYRNDCSGLVSEAWHLSTSYVTGDFNLDNSLWHTISWDSMQRGDAYVRHDSSQQHIELFAFWDDPHDHSKGFEAYSFNLNNYTVENPYELNNVGKSGHRTYSQPGFHAIRYVNIVISSSTVEGDIDGDGRADLVTSHSNGTAYVYPGTGSGTFGSATANFANTLNSALFDGTGHLLVGIADVTGDGHADLVSVSSSGSALVWPGRADRRFGSAVASFNGTMLLASATTTGHDPIAVADVTGDGRADLVTVHTNGNVYVYPGHADGTFCCGVASFSGTFNNGFRDGNGFWVAGVADVTGDGHADLVGVHSNGSAYVYPGRADGGFGGSTVSFAGTMKLATVDGQGHLPVGVADVNGDGFADLVTVNTNRNAYVYRGSASGAFGSAVASFDETLALGQFGTPGHQVIGVLDVNGDGHADLVTLLAGTAYVYPGTASGAFGESVTSFGGTMNSSFTDGEGHELIQMGPFPRRRVCIATGCRAP
jgi:hypothetical protein